MTKATVDLVMVAVACFSVGWLIQKDERVNALAPDMGEIEGSDHIQACGVIRIPTRAVTRFARKQEP